MGKRKLLVIDFETDPFLHDRLPIPFAWGAYDGDNYWHDWIPRAWETPRLCARTLVDFLKAQAAEGISYIIYAHNGGKFDFLFFLDELDGRDKDRQRSDTAGASSWTCAPRFLCDHADSTFSARR
jgi:hypothetical protein